MPDAPETDAPFALPQHLLWEYDLARFDYARHYRVAIERVIERGDLGHWQAAVRYYGREKFLTVSEESPRLSPRNRQFTRLAMESQLVEYGYRPGRRAARYALAA